MSIPYIITNAKMMIQLQQRFKLFVSFDYPFNELENCYHRNLLEKLPCWGISFIRFYHYDSDEHRPLIMEEIIFRQLKPKTYTF